MQSLPAIDTAEFRRRLDRMPISRLHIAVLTLCCVAFGFDLLEIALGGALSAIFSTSRQSLDQQLLPWLLASVYIGAVAGGPFFGRLADRHGRRTVLVGTLLILAVSSAMGAVSPDILWLTCARGASGLALGAYVPLVIAYLTEVLPAHNRGTLIFLVTGLACLGAPAGIFLIRELTPHRPLGVDGWRWALVVGALGSLVCAIAFTRLPESPVWLASRRLISRAAFECDRLDRSSAIFRSGSSIDTTQERPALVSQTASLGQGRMFAILCMLSFLSPWATAAFPLLSGAVLMQKGLSLQSSLLLVGVSSFGPAISAPASLFIDRLSRRLVMACCAGAMIVCGAAFVSLDSMPILIVCGTTFMLAAALYIPSMNVYGAELFVTRSRGGFMTVVWTLNRIGAVLAPLLLVPLLRSRGGPTMFGSIAVTLALSLLLLSIAPRDRVRLPVA